MSYRRLEAPPPESSHHQYESLAASAAPGDYADEQRVATPWRLRTRHVPLWVRAEVDAKVWAGRPTAVTVLIAREDLGDAVDGRASDLAHGNADPDRPLLIEAVAAANVQVESAPTVLRDVPRAGASNIVAFSVRFTGTAVDKAELRILVSQDGVPLHRPLVLQPHILGHGPGRGQPTSTQQAALVAPPPAKRAVGRLVVHAAAVSGGVQVPVPQLRIWTEERGQYFVYRYELSLRDGRFRKGYESPQVRTSPRAYAEELYRKIELGWAETLDSAAFQQRLRSLGGLLWDELIPADLGAILWNLRDQTDGILLYSDEPYIPWELVHLKKPGTKVLPPGTHFLADLGLIRWRVQPLLDSLPALRDGVRHVIPDYPDPTLALTSLASERGFLQNALGSHPVTPHSRPVLEQLADEKLELLHFAGHGVSPAAGGADAMLLLEGETTPGYGTSPPTYRRETLLMAEVDQHFDRTSTPTTSGPDPAPGPIVVLNACQSGRLGPRLTSIGGFATVFVDRGASLFVGTLWSVGDEPALTFTLTFYMRLLAGDAVVTATTAARRAARANGDATWLAYTVYGHPRARLITAGDDSEIQ